MSWNRTPKNAVRIAALLPLLAIAPLTLGPTAKIQENRACAADGCVERMGDICYFDGNWIKDHYLKGTIE